MSCDIIPRPRWQFVFVDLSIRHWYDGKYSLVLTMASRKEDSQLKEIRSRVQEDDEEEFELEEEHLPFLFRALHVLADKWDSLCLQLGVKDVDQIHKYGTVPDDCLVLGLQSWLRGDTVSWKRLIEAIYQPAGGGHQRLAKEVSKSFKEMCIFKPIEQARTTTTRNICDSYSDVESAVAALQDMLALKVAPRWYQMGVILGARVSDLEGIRMEKLRASESELRALKAWLRNCENTTWQRLVDAVGHTAGGNHKRLAKSLSKKLDTKPGVNGASHAGVAESPPSQSPGITSQPPTDVQTAFVKTLQRGDRVNVVALQKFSTPSQTINILHRVGPCYNPMLGNILLKSGDGQRVRGCQMTHHDDVERVVYDIFQKWCTEDDNCTWGHLVLHLQTANLNALASDIDSALI